MSDRLVPGVVFDVDGTLLDTNYLHVVAWIRALRENGYEDVTMAQVHGAIGIASGQLVEHLTGGSDEAVAAAHTRKYEPFQGDVRAFPRAAELMHRCHDAGLRVVIATSGQEKDLEWMLPAIGVPQEIVAGASTSADVENAKPAPDLLSVAMSKSDVDPACSVALGDTVWDIKAAADAGVPCIALACGGIGAKELAAAGAVEVWDSPADLLEHFEESRIYPLVDGNAR